MKDSPKSFPELLDSLQIGKSQILRHRLENGLEIISWEDQAAPIIAFQTWYRVGSRHDLPGESGMAHLFEHMMFKATQNHPEGQYDRLMEERGIETNAATWVDWTYYSVKLPSWELDMVLELESDRMQHLALSEDMLEREREVVINERLLRVDNDPEGKLMEALYRELFQGHPYGIPTIGWMKDIESISLSACNAFYERHYCPNQAVICVAGDFKTQELLEKIQEYYGTIPRGTPFLEEAHPLPNRNAPSRLSLRLPLQTPLLVRASLSAPLSLLDQAALSLMNELLTGQDSAHLPRRLIDKLELASEVSSWESHFTKATVFELFLVLQEGENLKHLEEALDQALLAFLSKPPSLRSLQRAKNSLEAEFFRDLNALSERAEALGHHHISSADYRTFMAHYDNLQQVSPEDIHRVASYFLDPKRTVTALLLPSEEEGSSPSKEAHDG